LIASSKPSLLKNWSYLLASDITQQAVGFLIVIVLARKLAPEGYGQYSVILSLVAIVSIFANFGMNLVLTREITLNPNHTKRYISLIAPIRTASFLISIVAFLVYFYIYNGDQTTLIFVTLIVFNLVLWDICESIAFGHFITKYSSSLNIIFATLWLLAIVVSPNQLFNVTYVLIIYSSILFLKAFCYMVLIKRNLLATSKTDEDSIIGRKKLISMSLPYLWMRGLGVLVDQVPILILSTMSGAKEVGYFSVGTKLMVPVTMSLSTALRAMFPFMTKLYWEDKILFSRKIQEGITFVVCLGTVIALFTSISSIYWIPFIFGNSYIPSIESFNFLIWFGVILTIDLLLSASLSSSYKQNALAILTTIDVVIAIPLYYLGAMHGALGLSIAKFIFGIIVLTYHWIAFSMLLKVKIGSKDIIILGSFFCFAVAICFIQISFSAKVLLAFLLLGVYAVRRDSPLRQSYRMVMSFAFSGNKK